MFPVIEFDETVDETDPGHIKITYVKGLGLLLTNHIQRIYRNHNNSLMELAKTGLGWIEIQAILEDRVANNDDDETLAKTKVMIILGYHGSIVAKQEEQRLEQERLVIEQQQLAYELQQRYLNLRPQFLEITAHCKDMGSFALLGPNNECIYEYDGYVPYDLGIGGDDDVVMTIDLDTGKIVDWERPCNAALQNFISGDNDDD